MKRLQVVLIKASKYGLDGFVQRYWRGFMPNATLRYMEALTPDHIGDMAISVTSIDEYVHMDASYLSLLQPQAGERVLLAVVGVQSHQVHRAGDLAAYAVQNGCMAVIGGPHPVTCDTSMLQGKGVSFCLAEAEARNVWLEILTDAMKGELAPLYGQNQRWATELNPPALDPPSKDECRRYLGHMMGIYPARGCPKTCNFCSVIMSAGRNVRSQPIETTIQTLLAAQANGVELIMFTSDNFNKYREAVELLETMIDAKIRIPFMCQCDTDILEQPKLVALMGRANCFQVFIGAETFDRKALMAVHKGHNKPAKYGEIVNLLAEHGIAAHFSNIIGFPTDMQESIRYHLEELKTIAPVRASFYMLMHIPGTQRYGELLPTGAITELNMDRLDASCPTWQHPNMTDQQWSDMMRYCHEQFYSLKQVGKTVARMLRGHPNLRRQASDTAIYAGFARLMAQKNRNPMSGGMWEVKADHVSQYLPLRRNFYGVGDLFPLPNNLVLSVADQALNRKADDKTWRLQVIV